MDSNGMHGSRGERRLQELYGTRKRAEQFYKLQVLDHLNEEMRDFIARRDLVFVSTADGEGNCDATIRAGAPGFVRVIDEKTLAYPEYRGNGVMASLGNISENGHVGLLFVDFYGARVGLHVNGSAAIVNDVRAIAGTDDAYGQLEFANGKGRSPLERWVLVTVDEAYIHCSKHIPRFEKIQAERRLVEREPVVQDGDYFRARRTTATTATF
jgi:hypothetical protein